MQNASDINHAMSIFCSHFHHKDYILNNPQQSLAYMYYQNMKNSPKIGSISCKTYLLNFGNLQFNLSYNDLITRSLRQLCPISPKTPNSLNFGTFHPTHYFTLLSIPNPLLNYIKVFLRSNLSMIDLFYVWPEYFITSTTLSG